MTLTKKDLNCVMNAVFDREDAKKSTIVRCIRLTPAAKQFLINGKLLQEDGIRYNTNITWFLAI